MWPFHVGDCRNGTEIVTPQAENACSVSHELVGFFIMFKIVRRACADTQATSGASRGVDGDTIAPTVEGGPERDALEKTEEMRERIEALE